MGPQQSTETAVPIHGAQEAQSSQTQAGAVQTGADLLNTMAMQRQQKLYQAQDAINHEISKTIDAAATPVPVSGTSAVTKPELHSWSGVPTDYSPRYSSRGANQQAVGNVARGAASIVGAFITKHQNDQQKSLAVDIERIMEAHQGIETARQALQQNPQDANAKAAIQKNQDIINAMLNDPKKRKQIGKAFDVNFVDPSQNNKPEHAALKDAISSYSEQLEKKLPTQMGPNQVAQQKLGQLTELSKTIDEQIRAVSMDKTASLYERALEHQDNLDLKNRELAAKTSHWADQLSQRASQFDSRMKMMRDNAQLLSDTRLKVADKQVQGRLAAVNAAIKGRIDYLQRSSTTRIGQLKANYDLIKIAQTGLNQLTTQILQAQTLYNSKGASDQDKQQLQKYINSQEAMQEEYRQMINGAMQKASELQAAGGDENNGSGSDNSGPSINNSDDITIPEPIAPVRPSQQGKTDQQGSGSSQSAASSSSPKVQTSGPTDDKSAPSVDELVKRIKGA